ncbi:MAG: ATPase domain-containing protein [bacterium]
MIDKTRTGVTFFDGRHGGVYRGRPFLVSGRSGAGKTVLGLQFALQGVQQDERTLMLSVWRAKDLMIMAESLGLPMSAAVSTGMLSLLEYSDFVPGRDREAQWTLPPDDFLQLQSFIDQHAIRRVVLDTVLPWIALRTNPEKLSEHLFSFVRAFDRMGVTALFTMPRPVSPAAFRLKHKLEELMPVAITLQRTEAATGHWLFNVTKYLGEASIDEGIPYQVVPGVGMTELIAAPALSSSAASVQQRSTPESPAATSAQAGATRRILFSSVISGTENSPSENNQRGGR